MSQLIREKTINDTIQNVRFIGGFLYLSLLNHSELRGFLQTQIIQPHLQVLDTVLKTKRI